MDKKKISQNILLKEKQKIPLDWKFKSSWGFCSLKECYGPHIWEDVWASDGLGIEYFRSTMSIKSLNFLLPAILFDDIRIRWERKILDKLAPKRSWFDEFLQRCQQYVMNMYVNSMFNLINMLLSMKCWRDFVGNLNSDSTFQTSLHITDFKCLPYVTLEHFTPPTWKYILENKQKVQTRLATTQEMCCFEWYHQYQE